MNEREAIYKRAVAKAIQENHAKGLPVYQAKDDYIVAIYPDGREVRLQKVPPLRKSSQS